jgi:hypothetical protein
MGLCLWRRRTSSMRLPVMRSRKQFYELQAWVVMPNHVHMSILPHAALSQITHWIKGRTAREANLLLGRTGEPFWQDESHDHWVRRARRTYVCGYGVLVGHALACPCRTWRSGQPCRNRVLFDIRHNSVELPLSRSPRPSPAPMPKTCASRS